MVALRVTLVLPKLGNEVGKQKEEKCCSGKRHLLRCRYRVRPEVIRGTRGTPSARPLRKRQCAHGCSMRTMLVKLAPTPMIRFKTANWITDRRRRLSSNAGIGSLCSTAAQSGCLQSQTPHPKLPRHRCVVMRRNYVRTKPQQIARNPVMRSTAISPVDQAAARQAVQDSKGTTYRGNMQQTDMNEGRRKQTPPLVTEDDSPVFVRVMDQLLSCWVFKRNPMQNHPAEDAYIHRQQRIGPWSRKNIPPTLARVWPRDLTFVIRHSAGAERGTSSPSVCGRGS